MLDIGMTELIVIAIVALFVVGPKRLPDLARSLGKGFQEFKKAAEDMADSIKKDINTDEIKKEMNDFKDSMTDKNHNDTPPASPH